MASITPKFQFNSFIPDPLLYLNQKSETLSEIDKAARSVISANGSSLAPSGSGDRPMSPLQAIDLSFSALNEEIDEIASHEPIAPSSSALAEKTDEIAPHKPIDLSSSAPKEKDQIDEPSDEEMESQECISDKEELESTEKKEMEDLTADSTESAPKPLTRMQRVAQAVSAGTPIEEVARKEKMGVHKLKDYLRAHPKEYEHKAKRTEPTAEEAAAKEKTMLEAIEYAKANPKVSLKSVSMKFNIYRPNFLARAAAAGLSQPPDQRFNAVGDMEKAIEHYLKGNLIMDSAKVGGVAPSTLDKALSKQGLKRTKDE